MFKAKVNLIDGSGKIEPIMALGYDASKEFALLEAVKQLLEEYEVEAGDTIAVVSVVPLSQKADEEPAQ